MKIGVIGGGATGLAAAYELLKRGHQVALFERGPQLGGLVATFEVGGGRLERFYKHIFVSDTDIQDYIRELGLEDRLRWISTKVGFFHGDKIFDFVTPTDLLRFTPLSLANRVRLGLVSLYLQRQAHWGKYEGVTAQEWIRRYAGEENYRVVWEPLLRGKFGASAPEVGMVWFWGKMRLRFGSRGKDMGSERLGYLLGSFGQVWDRVAQRIGEMGGEIHIGAPVRQVAVEGDRAVGIVLGEEGKEEQVYRCDGVIATVPSAIFQRLAPQLSPEYQELLRGSRYLGILCFVLVLKRPLSQIYWLNVSDPTIPFVGVIEQTNLIEPSHYGGKHVVYLSNYIDTQDPLYQLGADELLAHYLPHIQKINPHFDADWIEEHHLFKDAAAQPIITPHYSQRIPPHRTPISGLYLANMAQIYPQDRGQNYSIRMAREVIPMVEKDLARQPERAGRAGP